MNEWSGWDLLFLHKRQSLSFCVYSLDSIPCLLGYSKAFHKLHNNFWNTNICYFGCSCSYSERNTFLCFIYVHPLTRCQKFPFTWHCSCVCVCVCVCVHVCMSSPPPHNASYGFLHDTYFATLVQVNTLYPT